MKREYLLISLFFVISAAILYLFLSDHHPVFRADLLGRRVRDFCSSRSTPWLLRHVKRRGLASLIVCALIVVLIIGPVSYLFVALVNEAAGAVTEIQRDV